MHHLSGWIEMLFICKSFRKIHKKCTRRPSDINLFLHPVTAILNNIFNSEIFTSYLYYLDWIYFKFSKCPFFNMFPNFFWIRTALGTFRVRFTTRCTRLTKWQIKESRIYKRNLSPLQEASHWVKFLVGPRQSACYPSTIFTLLVPLCRRGGDNTWFHRAW